MGYVVRVMIAVAVSGLIAIWGYACATIPAVLLSSYDKEIPGLNDIVKIFGAGLVTVVAFGVILSSLELAKGKLFWLLMVSMFAAFCIALPVADRLILPLQNEYISKIMLCAQFCMCVIAGFAIVFRDELSAAIQKKRSV